MKYTIVGAVLLSIAGVAGAADLEAMLKTCAGLRNGAERLACYDHAVAQIDSDSIDAVANVIAPEAMFGMSRQVRNEEAPSKSQREEISSISARVKSLERAADGSLLIELDNGQTWRQTDSRKLLLEVGDTVTISRAAMSSFRIAAPDNRFGRVKRVQ